MASKSTISYVTEDTKWMSDQITGNNKDLVARFYELADSKQSDAGQLMATEVFSEDAALSTPGGTFKGFKGIEAFYYHFPKSLYVANPDRRNIQVPRSRLGHCDLKKTYTLQGLCRPWRQGRAGGLWDCANDFRQTAKPRL